MTRHVGIAMLITLVAGTLLAGCASSSSAPGGASTSSFVVPVEPVADDQYVIQRRDTISVTFATHPDHDQPDLLVRDDGKITLPLVGDVHAAGLTPPQLADRLVQLYSANLRDPSIAVNVHALEQELIWVGGQVRQPGIVRYRRNMTASQALMAAGGPNNLADIKDCVLLQKVNTAEYRASKIDLAKVIENGDTKADPVLGPRDVMVIPMSGIAKANVWVRQYLINMIPIQFNYKTPDPGTASQDTTTSGSGSGTGSGSTSSSGAAATRPSSGGTSTGSAATTAR